MSYKVSYLVPKHEFERLTQGEWGSSKHKERKETKNEKTEESSQVEGKIEKNDQSAKEYNANRKQKTESFKWQEKETKESSQVEGKIEKNDQGPKEYKAQKKTTPN